MGRKGVTYEQVQAAADALNAERPGSVTLLAVRAHLGNTGSLNTIHRFLKQWDENRPKIAAPVVEIPDDVRKALSGWVIQASTGARAEAEERSVIAQASADELAKAGEDLERERDDLVAQIADLTTQRDQEQATALARAEDIKRLEGEVERERKLAGEAQVAAAEARLRVEQQAEHLADARARSAKLEQAIETERMAREKAEREGAVTAVQLDGARTDLDAARAQVTALQQDLASTRERAEQARSAADARAQQDQARIDQVRQDYETRLDEQRRALEQARAHLAAAAVEKAQLQERLSALTGSEKE
jgi:chromosome segregation ATPase